MTHPPSAGSVRAVVVPAAGGGAGVRRIRPESIANTSGARGGGPSSSRSSRSSGRSAPSSPRSRVAAQRRRRSRPPESSVEHVTQQSVGLTTSTRRSGATARRPAGDGPGPAATVDEIRPPRPASGQFAARPAGRTRSRRTPDRSRSSRQEVAERLESDRRDRSRSRRSIASPARTPFGRPRTAVTVGVGVPDRVRVERPGGRT